MLMWVGGGRRPKDVVVCRCCLPLALPLPPLLLLKGLATALTASNQGVMSQCLLSIELSLRDTHR
jgi:hypothetical protein